MGLQLPGPLIGLLADLGYTWPEADEEKLFEMGRSWLDFATGTAGELGEAGAHAQAVWGRNEGAAVEAFRTSWTGREAPAANLEDAGTAATMVGAGLMVCAGIALTLKINVIVQLVSLAIEIAEALATAAPTFGASLAEIPIFKEITGALIDLLVNEALNAVLGG